MSITLVRALFEAAEYPCATQQFDKQTLPRLLLNEGWRGIHFDRDGLAFREENEECAKIAP